MRYYSVSHLLYKKEGKLKVTYIFHFGEPNLESRKEITMKINQLIGEQY